MTLTDNDRQLITRARAIRDLNSTDAIRQHTGEDDTKTALMNLLDETKWVLGGLADTAERLGGEMPVLSPEPDVYADVERRYMESTERRKHEHEAAVSSGEHSARELAGLRGRLEQLEAEHEADSPDNDEDDQRLLHHLRRLRA